MDSAFSNYGFVPVRDYIKVVARDKFRIPCEPVFRFILIILSHGFLSEKQLQYKNYRYILTQVNKNNYNTRIIVIFRHKSGKTITRLLTKLLTGYAINIHHLILISYNIRYNIYKNLCKGVDNKTGFKKVFMAHN